ncbi:MAG TPA: hypothetical protein VFB12_06795, partial [Ktedonobacteraceae bacterium]|nr:hypothetical protein [Ktedonobacteraceae bacterium]
MAGRGSSPHDEEHIPGKKKSGKQKRRLQERVQEAHEAQSKAEERYQRALARLEKKQARLQQLERELAAMYHQVEALPVPLEDAGQEQLPFDTSTMEAPSPQVPDGVSVKVVITEITSAQTEPLLAGSDAEDVSLAIERATQARAIAEASEEAARAAIEMALAARAEQLDTSRHLEEELAHPQTEAERAKEQAQEAEVVASEAEQQVTNQTYTSLEASSRDADS